MYAALVKHWDAIELAILPFSRNEPFQSAQGREATLNMLVVASLPTDLRQRFLDQHRKDYKQMAFDQFRHHVFQAASYLELHGNIRAYLITQRMKPGESLAAFHEVLDTLLLAFPVEMQQRPVIIML